MDFHKKNRIRLGAKPPNLIKKIEFLQKKIEFWGAKPPNLTFKNIKNRISQKLGGEAPQSNI